MSHTTTLPERIIEAREAIGLSDAKLANRLGVKLGTIQNWESGQLQPRSNKLQMLAGVLGVSLLWLIQGDDEHNPMIDRPTRLDQLEQKVQRMGALQREISQLGNEIASELATIKRLDDQLDDLAA